MKKLFPLGVMTAALLSAGCGNLLKSTYHPPAITYPAQWQEPINIGTSVPFAWQDFHDPQLQRWLQQVLVSNNDLALAALRLYRANLDAQRVGIDTAPSVNANLGMTGTKNVNSSSSWNKGSNASIGVEYQVDLWGKLARQRDAAEWARQATAQDLAAARLTLLSEASKNYWQIAYLNQRITVSTQSIEHAKATLKLVNARYLAGDVASLDVVDAEQFVAAQENAHLALLSQRKQALNMQAVLLGTAPGNTLVEPQHLPTGPLPQISADIPASVLSRRPDISASELRLREALANVDVKRSEYYPAFNLTSSIGGTSDALLKFVQNPIATLGAGLTLPFLQFRLMNVDINIARNDYQQRILSFKQSLYKAMAGVENALVLRTQLLAQEKKLQYVLELAYKSERLNETRYRNGATPINFWLDAQEKRRLAQVEVDTNRYEQLQNLADIYEQMGGNSDSLKQ